MPHLPDSHHDHDAALVAALAAGDTRGREHEAATRLVASCTRCAALRDDLVAISSALHTLPAPRRTRDYRLTDAEAVRLRRAGWRRLLGAFAGPRFRLAAPLGTTMATLGVAGLLFASLPTAVISGPQAAPGGAAESMTTLDQTSASPAASAAAPAAAPPASTGPEVAGDGSYSIDEETNGRDTQGASGAGGQSTPGRTSQVEASPDLLAVRAADETLTILGGALVLLGIGLLALRWSARRLA